MMQFCTLASGSSGNVSLIRVNETRLLLDAGLSGKAVCDLLAQVQCDPSELDGILVTHEHSDHIRGVGVLSRKFDLPIYANEPTWEALDQLIGKIDKKNRRIIFADSDFFIQDACIRSFSIPHDAASPMGYTFWDYKGEGFMTCATDMGHMTEAVFRGIKHSNAVLIESNHDEQMLKRGSYPEYLKKRILSTHGHLSNNAAAEAVVKLADCGVKAFLLGHLSAENNTPELAYETSRRALEEAGYRVGRDIHLEVANRSRPNLVLTL